MTFAGSVHPLDIPEILLCVGKFIPLWIPKAPIPPAHDVTYLFRPRDLLAAIAVNRTFQRTLTPLLWVVCNFISQRGKFDKINGHYSPPLELLLSCSRHFRFLEFRSIGKDIRLKCTHLQELKLSRWVDRDVGLDLISANKRLTLLSWDFPNLATEPMQEKDYVVLGELKKLKVLQLRHWAVDLDRFLAAGLAPIAAVLEELSLSNIRGFALYRTTVGIGTSYTRSVHAPFTTAVTTTTLPKLKTLLLDRLRGMGNRDCGIDNEVLELIRICPNLETVIIHLDHKCDTEKIGRYLRDHCPKLNAIRCVDMLQSEILLDDEDYVALIQGCVPPSSSKSSSTIDTTRPEGQGLRVFEMGIECLTSTITGALMAHSDCLETLILYIHSAEVEHFNHACQLLSQCRHLQKFEMYNYRMRWSPCDGMLLLKDPWACRGLKSLALGGFGGRWEEEQDGYPDALQEQQIQQYLEAFDCYSEVIDEHAYDDGHISGRDSSKQGPMSDRKAVLEKKRYRTVTRGDEIILGNWHRSTASMYRNDCLLPGQGFEFKRKFLQVANSLPSLENVSLNYVDYVRGATHEVPLK
ncbi:hypothetical protein BGZ58_006392 [Dissophora ornata]|nr:hypothetical protein BGZ58_006392 [Dissophora ornata]